MVVKSVLGKLGESRMVVGSRVGSEEEEEAGIKM